MDTEKKRRQEQKIVQEIIRIYCHGHHHPRPAGEDLCADCRRVAIYADERILHCPRMEIKTFCSACPVHCYAPKMRKKMQEVMAYGGPRMLLHHPLLTLRHIWIQWRTRHGLRRREAVV